MGRVIVLKPQITPDPRATWNGSLSYPKIKDIVNSRSLCCGHGTIQLGTGTCPFPGIGRGGEYIKLVLLNAMGGIAEDEVR
jgi:hypothetical protein